ncbi:MAG: ribosomal protein S18-alanine N-acetyltransferase [Clostridiales bacterium]|nr:ribosomal protein S18-alanine N-acetyltransferase [Clostridiales bacterium]
MSNFTFLIANKDHVDDMHVIEKQSFITPWSHKSIYDDVVNNEMATYIVVLNLNKVVGYLGFWTIIDEAHITTLAIEKTYRRKHLALELFYEMMDMITNDGVMAITLEVRENNIPAISLYKKLGFKREGIRKNYYQDTNENALIMWKIL